MTTRTISVVTNGVKTYEIILTLKFEGLLEQIKKLGYEKQRKICIVTDSNVSGYYAEEVKNLLKLEYETVMIHSFPAGEESKNLDTVNKLYEDLILNHFDRKDLLVALGGGVVGDLTGFAAATYLRGIDFIQVPTTLLSQVDSSIGGKTGVDFMQYKNMVGAFYQPKLVYMNMEVLQTLPPAQRLSGMGEIIKHGLIKDYDYFSWLLAHKREIEALDLEVMTEMIYRSCNIKREVVEHDPKEQGERALLNFGHTIGHAVEKLSDFKLYHGECVALGMVAAAYLSWKLANISEQDFRLVKDTIAAFGFRTEVTDFDPKKVLEATKSDKKMIGSKVKFVLLNTLGNAYLYTDLTDEQILDGIRYICR